MSKGKLHCPRALQSFRPDPKAPVSKSIFHFTFSNKLMHNALINLPPPLNLIRGTLLPAVMLNFLLGYSSLNFK
jgi:hypothetical protein